MGAFSNLSAQTFLVMSLVVSYIMTTSEEDYDEKISFSNFLILVAFVMKNDAQQGEIFQKRKERIRLAKLEEQIVYLSNEINSLKAQQNNSNNELNKKT